MSETSTRGQRAGRRAGRVATILAIVVAALLVAPLLTRGLGAPEPAPLVERRLTELRTAAPESSPTTSAAPAAGATADVERAEGADTPTAGAPPALTKPIAFDREADLRAGRLIIPAIGLDTTWGLGVHDEVLRSGPGHWPGTPLPGQPGNAVLSGHRTTWTHPFGELDRLAVGDVITAAVGTQPGADYRVVATRIIPEAEYVDAVLAQPQDPSARTITLFACHPKGSRTHRIVVTAAADPLPTGEAGA